MSDAQDESGKEQTKAKDEVVMDEVVEERPVVTKKSGFTGFVITLVLLSGAAGAAWYYQSMWWPQVQDGTQQAQIKVQQAQAWLNDLFSFGKEDEAVVVSMPKVEPSKTNEENSKPNYVVAAISDPEPVVEKEQHDIVKEESPAAKDEELSKKPAVDVIDTKESAKDIEESAEVVVDESAVMLEPVTNKEEMVVPEIVAAELIGMESEAETPVVEVKRSAVNLTYARQAFWQRDLPKAEALYKEQIKTAEINADSWGELGNVYYLQAKWQQAATAYTEAALILLKKGNFPQAMFLRYIVIGLDPAQAQRIDEYLQTLQAPLHG